MWGRSAIALHFPDVVLHHISAKASIRSMSKLAAQCTVLHSPTLEKLGTCELPDTQAIFLPLPPLCVFLTSDLLKWTTRSFFNCADNGILKSERNQGCKGLRLYPRVCFLCGREKSDEKGEESIFAHCEIKAEPDCLCVWQTEGRVPQTLALCPLFSFLLSDRGPCEVFGFINHQQKWNCKWNKSICECLCVCPYFIFIIPVHYKCLAQHFFLPLAAVWFIIDLCMGVFSCVCVCGYTSVLDSVFLNPAINNSPLSIYSNKSASKFNCQKINGNAHSSLGSEPQKLLDSHIKARREI